MKNKRLVKCLGERDNIKYVGNRYTLALTTILEGREGEYDDIAVKYNMDKEIESITVLTFNEKGVYPNPSITEKLTTLDKEMIINFVRNEGLENEVFANIEKSLRNSLY